MADQVYGSIEAGGTKFVCAVGTGPADVRAETRFPTTSPDETIGRAIAFFDEQRQRWPLAAIGVGAFGPIDLRRGSTTYGYVTSTPKPGWMNADFVGRLRSALHVPVGFDTDVNAAALGEHRWGAAQDVDSCVYITIGTGIGAGLCNLLIAPLFTSVGPTVGASGAVYGILVAFGYLFPDRSIYIYGLIPVKAKFLVIIYMLIELFAVAGGTDSGIAHFAHLGGGIIGFLYLLIFNRRGTMNFFGNSGLRNRFTSYSSDTGSRKSVFVPGNGSSIETAKYNEENIPAEEDSSYD